MGNILKISEVLYGDPTEEKVNEVTRNILKEFERLKEQKK
jgi:hypothetical protein